MYVPNVFLQVLEDIVREVCALCSSTTLGRIIFRPDKYAVS
jgi:hypothetical protein